MRGVLRQVSGTRQAHLSGRSTRLQAQHLQGQMLSTQRSELTHGRCRSHHTGGINMTAKIQHTGFQAGMGWAPRNGDEADLPQGC